MRMAMIETSIIMWNTIENLQYFKLSKIPKKTLKRIAETGSASNMSGCLME